MAKRNHRRAMPSVRRGSEPVKAETRPAPRRKSSSDARQEFAVGDSARANANAPKEYAHREGIVTEIGPGRTEYRVEFEDGRRPTTGYLIAGWLARQS